MKNRNIPLRTWASPSYDRNTGKQASAFTRAGDATTIEGMSCHGDSQVSASHGAAEGGAPALPRGATQGKRER
jgi:hypothetical protein